MFCPQCEAEYREGITECVDCEVPLVEGPLPGVEHPEPDMVEVLETSDPSLLPVVVSLLQSAGIEPDVQGDEVMGVLPVGEFGGAGWTSDGHGLRTVVRVPRARAAEALELLAGVEEESTEGDGAEAEEPSAG